MINKYRYDKSILLLSAVLCSVFLALGNVAMATTYKANTPAWRGEWIWLRTGKASALSVNLSRFLIRHPGGWREALVNRILGNAAIAGVQKVYWHLDDGKGNALFPCSKTSGLKVLNWSNWGCDFGAFDFPAWAMQIAKRLDLKLVFVADASFIAEAQNRYPGASIITGNKVEPDVIAASDFKPAKTAIEGLSNQTLLFRRVIRIDENPVSAYVCLTAQKNYSFFLDGKLLAKDGDWWRGETYDLTSLLCKGKHEIMVRVESDKDYSGLLFNLKYTTANGETVYINSDLQWECCLAEDSNDQWRKVDVVGFEGIGPRFRLKNVWQNPTMIISDDFAARRIPPSELEITASVNQDQAERIVDEDTGPGSWWKAEGYPASIRLNFKSPKLISEVRIYPGNPSFYGNPSGACSPKSYRLQALVKTGWIDLVEPVTQAADYRGEAKDNYVFVHAFTPRTAAAVRLLITGSYDTGRRLASPNKISVPEGKRASFIRELVILKAPETDSK